ncbi:MAG TPA: aquaporin [Acidimicrobiia bacterium]|jgi:aquaporin Z
MTEAMRRYVAELIGTLILVFVGGLAILGGLATGGADVLVIALGFGLALLVGLYAVGEVSGGHFNPAVSLAALLDGRINLTEMIGYWVSQVAGAVIAALLLLWAADQDAVAATTTRVSTGAGSGFLLELALTAVFVMVILKVTKSDAYGGQALTVIPLALVAVHLASVPFTGTSVNPARTLGPGIVGSQLADLWIYLLAPLAGAVVGWALYQITTKGTIEMAVDTE